MRYAWVMTPYALVIGESLVDVVAAQGVVVGEHPGGSAANVAVALARLGRPVRLATSFADDAHGRLLLAHLEASGVGLASDPHVVGRTSTATATLDATGAASYAFDLHWRLGQVRLDPAPLVVHVCSIGAVLDPGASAVRAAIEALAGETVVSYDLNLRTEVTGAGPEVRKRVLEIVAAADVVKASDEDLADLFGDVPVEEVAGELLEKGPAVVVVTRGGDGADCFLPQGEVVRGRSTPVVVADTIGAGDTFSAAMIDALWARGALSAESLRSHDAGVWQQVLAHAARAAAVTVSRPGADPPYRRELDD